MNLSEIVDVVSEKSGLSKEKTQAVIRTTFDTIRQEVSLGGRVLFVGFGAFYSARRSARKGRNPHTGEDIKIQSKVTPRFKAGRLFKDSVGEPVKKKKGSPKRAPKPN